MEEERWWAGWLVTREAFGVTVYWWRDSEGDARALGTDIAAAAAEDGHQARVEMRMAGPLAIHHPNMVAGVGP